MAKDKPNIIYRFCRFVCFVLFKIIWGLRVEGAENVPSQGGVIIAANHRSYGDPPLVGVTSPRTVHFLAKKELFNFKPFGWLISQLNSHPLNREGGGIGAIKVAQRLLEKGYVVIVFPEGRRNKTDQLARAKPGVGLLSLTSQCPVVPTYIHNSGYLMNLKRLSVHFGKPLQPDSFSTYQELADAVMNQIQHIKSRVEA
jgi:1-acyl-sn-glycerol-3-phosphate acyltransferase